jgi:hypothetical protein
LRKCAKYWQVPLENTTKYFFKRLNGLGSEPGIFLFHLFSHSIT